MSIKKSCGVVAAVALVFGPLTVSEADAGWPRRVARAAIRSYVAPAPVYRAPVYRAPAYRAPSYSAYRPTYGGYNSFYRPYGVPYGGRSGISIGIGTGGFGYPGIGPGFGYGGFGPGIRF